MATNGSFGQQDQFKNEAYPATGAPASNSDEQDTKLTKDEIGWYFVEQYYTTLSKNPEKLHVCFLIHLLNLRFITDNILAVLWKALSICLGSRSRGCSSFCWSCCKLSEISACKRKLTTSGHPRAYSWPWLPRLQSPHLKCRFSSFYRNYCYSGHWWNLQQVCWSKEVRANVCPCQATYWILCT